MTELPSPSCAPPGAERRGDCARYGRCLDVALASRWPGFSCGACPAYRPLSDEQRALDALRLLELRRAAGLGVCDG